MFDPNLVQNNFLYMYGWSTSYVCVYILHANMYIYLHSMTVAPHVVHGYRIRTRRVLLPPSQNRSHYEIRAGQTFLTLIRCLQISLYESVFNGLSS